MNDFKIIARLLAAIRASEESPVFDVALAEDKPRNVNNDGSRRNRNKR